MKTNATRILEGLGIQFELRDYSVDPEDLSAETVARKIGLPPEQVFKTLVARGDRSGICLAVIPGNCELDLKALAKATCDRKIELAPLKEVQPLTGYIRGGVTALACKKEYPVYLEETAILFDKISVSAGVRGTQIILAPDDYIRAVSATTAEISREKNQESEMATLGLVEYEQASPEVRAVYDDIMATRKTGWINNFWKALARDPATLKRTWQSIKEIMAPDGPLDPLFKEMIYVAVSATNQCGYCIASHTAAARKAGMTDEMFMELMAVVGMANETNRLASGYQVEIDEPFRV